jgi:site-specific DNA recombinase
MNEDSAIFTLSTLRGCTMKQIAHSKRVGIWIRVSTEDQVRGESPEHHEHRARLYAEAKGWTIIEVYRLDAVSGKTVKDTHQAKLMLEHIRTGHITGLIFSKLARLARNTKELLDFSDIFREQGADLISLAESIDTSSPAGRLFYTMIAAMAQWEREETSSRVSASVPIRAKLGKSTGGQASFGYQWKDGRLIPHPEDAPIRKLLYELFREHRRKKTVARLLNERGLRTRNGSKFSDTTVDRLLRDPTAKGIRRANYTSSTGTGKVWKFKPETEWVLTSVDPIVPETLWDECNAILDAQRAKQKRTSKKVTHLFSGLVECGCGGKMYVPSGMRKYTCQKCRNKMPIDDLERIFQEQIKTFLFSSAEIAVHLDKANVQLKEKELLLEVLHREHTKVSAEIDNLYDLYQAGAIDTHGFGRKYQPLSARQQQLENEIPRIQADIDITRITHLNQEEIIIGARDLYSHWSNLPADEKRRIVEMVVEKVVINGEEVEINLFYAPPTPSTPTSTPSDSSPPSPANPPQSDYKLATEAQGFMAAISWKFAGNTA